MESFVWPAAASEALGAPGSPTAGVAGSPGQPLRRYEGRSEGHVGCAFTIH